MKNVGLKLIIQTTGFLCSCGLYEFGGVFWLTYFNFFLQTSIGLKSSDIGIIVLTSQLVDAIGNPLVGFLVDNVRIPYVGNKRGWHIIGSFGIISAFPFMWRECTFCTTDGHKVIYYGIMSAMLNFMTPFIFLPHLSFIGILAKNEKQRVVYSEISSFAKQFWGLLAYTAVWVLVGADKDSELAQILMPKMQICSYLVVGVGIVATLYFHWTIHGDVTEKTERLKKEVAKQGSASLKSLATNPDVYLAGILYFLCRGTTTLYNIYQVFYYEQTLKLPKEAVGYLPFIFLSVAGLGCVAVKVLNKMLQLRTIFVGAAVLVAIGGVMFILQPASWGNFVILSVAIFSFGAAVMYTLALAFTSELIIRIKASDVVVWGVLNLFDRVLFGSLFMVLQEFRPCPTSRDCCEACAPFYRYAFGGGFIVFSILSIIICLILNRGKKEVRPAVDEAYVNKAIEAGPTEEDGVMNVEDAAAEAGEVVVENRSAI